MYMLICLKSFLQEAFIRSILSKPFKIPIQNYTGNSCSCHYGFMYRTIGKQVLTLLSWWITHRRIGNQGTWSKARRSKESSSRSLRRRRFGSLWTPDSERSWPDQSWQVGSEHIGLFLGLITFNLGYRENECGLCTGSRKYFISLTVIAISVPLVGVFHLFSFVFFRDKLQIHVVVDPVLGKVLRPHQREVNTRYIFLIFSDQESKLHKYDNIVL